MRKLLRQGEVLSVDQRKKKKNTKMPPRLYLRRHYSGGKDKIDTDPGLGLYTAHSRRLVVEKWQFAIKRRCYRKGRAGSVECTWQRIKM